MDYCLALTGQLILTSPSSAMFDNKMVTDQYRGFARQLMLWKILSLTN